MDLVTTALVSPEYGLFTTADVNNYSFMIDPRSCSRPGYLVFFAFAGRLLASESNACVYVGLRRDTLPRESRVSVGRRVHL